MYLNERKKKEIKKRILKKEERKQQSSIEHRFLLARPGCVSTPDEDVAPPARIPLRQPMTSGHVRPSDVTAYDACLIASNGQFSKASSVLLTVLARNQKIGQQRNERGAKRLPHPRWTVGIGVVSYPLSCHGSHISACLGPFSLFARLSRVRNSNNEEESSPSPPPLFRDRIPRSSSHFLLLEMPPRRSSSRFLSSFTLCAR